MIANQRHKHIHFLRMRITVIILGTVLMMFFLLIAFLIHQDKRTASTIYPGVYIDDIAVGLKTQEEVRQIFKEREQKMAGTSLYVMYQSDPLATFSAETLEIHTNIEEMYEKAYLIGRSPHKPSMIIQRITTLLGLQDYRFSSDVVYNKSRVKESVEQFEDAYNIDPKNALFKFENDRVIQFQKEEKGNKILADIFLKDVDQIIKSLKYRQQSYTITLQEKPVEPEITLAKINSFGIEEMIGEGYSNYSHSIPTRIHNVILGASRFNGVLIPKDKAFSFNDTIGDISARTGYQPAYIIKEGKTVLGDGGGVCQVSTTLFRAALNAGLPIIEQHPHAYRVSYYENDSKPGLDATVFAPSVDLKIENNTPAAILIQTIVNEDQMTLTFKLYGKRDKRNIQISTPVLFDVSGPPPDLYQDDPTLKRGIVKQVDFAAWGGKAKFDYKVTLGDKILFEKNFFSSYKPWRAVFLVGTQD